MDDNYNEEIENHRKQKDQFFKLHYQSPIPESLKSKFQGLDYFPISDDYYFELKLNKFDNPDLVEMQTSTNDIQQYRKIGFLTFPLNNENINIYVYQNVANPSYYFVPFRDNTSGNETYGAGRYIDVEKRGDLFVLDFNLAYNPYCAYSDNYSCPLPPYENWLKVSIEAGEKDFPLADH